MENYIFGKIKTSFLLGLLELGQFTKKWLIIYQAYALAIKKNYTKLLLVKKFNLLNGKVSSKKSHKFIMLNNKKSNKKLRVREFLKKLLIANKKVN